MASLVSPGVIVTEKDVSNYVANVSSSVGALVGAFQWGPLNEIKVIGSEAELVATFGKPDANSYVHFLSAVSFLSYTGALRVARVTAEGSSKNAVASGSAIIVKNRDHYDSSFSGGQASVGPWAAKYAGALGNSLKVSMCPSANAFSMTLTGTLSTSGTAVTGSGTAFTAELSVGDVVISAGGERRTVTAVASSTGATISSAFTVDLSAATVSKEWEYKTNFGLAPGTSAFATARSGVGDEMHIIVVDEDGVFTGIPGTVLERFYFVSKASDAKNDDGTSNYYKDVINNQSKYLYWMDHLSTGTNWGSAAATTTFTVIKKADTASLTGGVDANSSNADSDYQRGWALFADRTSVDISLCISAAASVVVTNYIIDNILETRKDCVGFFSPLLADVVNNVGSESSAVIVTRNNYHSTTYGVMDPNWKLMYDRYNDTYRYLPVNADIAGLCARTDFTNDAWWSPAGYNRGKIKNVTKLAWNPSQANRDDLYLNSVNLVVNEKGVGPLLFSDKTMTLKPSAFDHINVRRLFIVLEKAISNSIKYLLFEFNDVNTRLLANQIIEPYLRDVMSRRGILGFKVVCDETNNTPEVIDRNELVIDIYIKPSKSINVINLNFIATKTGSTFTELVTNQANL